MSDVKNLRVDKDEIEKMLKSWLLLEHLTSEQLQPYVEQLISVTRLDVESLTTQLDMILETYTRHLLSESKAHLTNKELRALAVAEVLELLGMKGKE